MRHTQAIALLTLVFSLLGPARAQAWGIEWLDQLTGPGPFVGVRIDGRALCWLAEEPLQGPGAAPPSRRVRPAWDPQCLRDGRAAGEFGGDADEMRAYLSLEAAWLDSAKNEMFPTLRFDPRTEVRLFSFRPALMVRAFRWVDAGVAVGLNRFSGPALVSSFNWVSVQPRVVFTPFANSRSRVARALEYRVDVAFIPERVRDEFAERVRQDLQERPGSFEGGELRLMVGIDVDLGRLF